LGGEFGELWHGLSSWWDAAELCSAGPPRRLSPPGSDKAQS
jgi:hypothetical protein